MKKDRSRSGPGTGRMTSHEAVTTLDDGGAVPVAVRLFAVARPRVGRPSVVLDLREPATVGDLGLFVLARWLGPAKVLSSVTLRSRKSAIGGRVKRIRSERCVQS
jgi:hypothetical protein